VVHHAIFMVHEGRYLMGMDVMGKNPTDEKGEYFRNNIWWWHPLWDYCSAIAPEICDQVENAHSNDGDGLDALDSEELSKRLYASLKDGTAKQYIKERTEFINTLPKRLCVHCRSTGTRQWLTKANGDQRSAWEYDYMSDIFGQGQTLPEYTPVTPENGETITETMCNGCNGEGKQEPHMASYAINQQNIREFARFLKTCGGFAIC
jgi:hypothetical protein